MRPEGSSPLSKRRLKEDLWARPAPRSARKGEFSCKNDVQLVIRDVPVVHSVGSAWCQIFMLDIVPMFLPSACRKYHRVLPARSRNMRIQCPLDKPDHLPVRPLACIKTDDSRVLKLIDLEIFRSSDQIGNQTLQKREMTNHHRIRF